MTLASLEQRNLSKRAASSAVSIQSSCQSSTLSEDINKSLDIERRKMNHVSSGMPKSDEVFDAKLVNNLIEDPDF